MGSEEREKKRGAGEKLSESEEQYRLLVENVPSVTWSADAEGKTTYISSNVERVYGYTRQEIYDGGADLWFGRIHPEDVGRVRHVFEQLVESSRMFDIEYRIQRKDGTWIWLRDQAASVEADKGELRAYGVFSDVTARKQAEELLRTEKEINDAALDAQLDTFFLFEPTSGKAVRWNRAFRDISGYTDEEIARLPAPKSYYGPEDLKRAAVLMKTVIETGTGTVELDLICKDGRKVPTEYRVSVVKDKRGEPQYLISIGREISERKRVEAQLVQADRLSSLGMLAAGVAHEINNPLSYILCNLESLHDELPRLLGAIRGLETRLNKQLGHSVLERIAGEYLGSINRPLFDNVERRIDNVLGGVRRIRDIAAGLRTFSRVEKDKLVLVKPTVVIDIATNMAQNEIKYRARLVKDYSKTPSVLASEGRLCQVFLNLLINAAHSIEEGHVAENEIRVRTWHDEGQVYIEVIDSGQGIKPEYMEKLFDPFFTTKHLDVGSGLGLSISKSIVESYGGTIKVYSELGKGANFVVCLPAQKGENEQPENLPCEAIEPEELARILLIDDEAAFLFTMDLALRPHETVVAESAAMARKILSEDTAFDVILCDMMMPDVSGVEFHKWLKREKPELSERLVFITGGVFTPKAREYLSSVENLVIEKPFDLNRLRRTVAEIVRRRTCS